MFSGQADGFLTLPAQEYGMPTRHISPQSFDEILSELGDDPAIPDPQGIRKPISPKTDAQTSHPSKLLQPSKALLRDGFLAHANLVAVLLGALLICLIGAFLTHLWLSQSPAPEENLILLKVEKDLQKMMKEMEMLQIDQEDELDELYTVIDELEVSIHSLKKLKGAAVPAPKAQSTLDELALQSWRYLGSAEMSGIHQALFHNGKSTLFIKQGDLVIGSWRLQDIKKDGVLLVNPEGKLMALKAKTSR
jgi:hypothetical protein